jgi:signal transduction histidine kinase
VHVVALVLLHRRVLRTTAILYVLSLWLMIFLRGYLYGGQAGGGISSFVTVVLVASLLLGPWAGFSITALSAVGVGTLSLLEQMGKLPIEVQEASPLLRVIAVSANFALIAFFVWFATHSYTSTLAEARSSQSLLLKSSNRLEAAVEIARLASAIEDIDAFQQSLAGLMAKRFGLYSVSIFTLNERQRLLTLQAESPELILSEETPEFVIPLEENSIVANVARTQQAYLAADIHNDPFFLPNENLPDARSELALPIISGNRIYGVFDIISDSEVPLSWDEVNVMQVITNQIGTAIHNLQLQQSRERHVKELEALHAIATAGMEATSEDELILRATRVVGESLFPTNFGVLLVDYESGQLVHHLSYSERQRKQQPAITLGEGVTGLVALSGQPMRIGDVREEPRYISVDSRARSELCVPIKLGARVLGVVNVESDVANAFSAEDEKLLMTLAGQLAISLEKIGLFNAAQKHARELGLALEKQEDVNRLKSEFIQNVSHELRTPLAIVSGYIEMVQTGEFGKVPAKYKQPFEIISRRVGLLTRLVDDLTSVLEVQSREQTFEPVALGRLIQSLVPGVEASAKSKHIELVMDLEPNCPSVEGEPTFLGKAIDNLLGNAIKFTPEGGRVEVRLKNEGEQVVLEVEDTGIGIPTKDRERIFERFYQVDGSSTRQYGGTGMGLALVQEVVQIHDGTVLVKSTEGSGSCFTVSLPVRLGGTQPASLRAQ